MLGIFDTLFRYREKKSPDKLGLFPEAVDISAMPERRYLWTSRILVILSAVSISLTMALAATIFLLLPQRGSSPRLYRTNPYTYKLERIASIEQSIGVQDLVTEQHIEQFLKLRHEIPESQAKLYETWSDNSKLYWLSSFTVFGDFKKKATFTQINDFIIKGMKRKIEIDWIRPLTQSLWETQFRSIITLASQEKPYVLIWRAYLRIKYETIPEEKTDYWQNNPFGFKVTHYSLAYIGTPEKSAGYLEAAKEATTKNSKAKTKIQNKKIPRFYSGDFFTALTFYPSAPTHQYNEK